jgi:hypothetical protein
MRYEAKLTELKNKDSFSLYEVVDRLIIDEDSLNDPSGISIIGLRYADETAVDVLINNADLYKLCYAVLNKFETEGIKNGNSNDANTK